MRLSMGVRSSVNGLGVGDKQIRTAGKLKVKALGEEFHVSEARSLGWRFHQTVI